MKNKVSDALLGLAVADALGVPVEFKTRKYLQRFPVTTMMGYGTYNQPEGTWSDDSSLTFCLAESLCNQYNITDIAEKFVRWVKKAYWTAHNELFDIGITTRSSIERLHSLFLSHQPITPLPEYEAGSREIGNGALMRILPLAFYVEKKPVAERFGIIREVAALTHAHIRSSMACFIYIEFALQILEHNDKAKAYSHLRDNVEGYLIQFGMSKSEITHFARILNANIYEFDENKIESSGYALHALEAALWCIMRYNSYKTTVLAAVNLGSDTDTTAAIAGGIAGIMYGAENIPQTWLEVLARRNDIIQLADELNSRYINDFKIELE